MDRMDFPFDIGAYLERIRYPGRPQLDLPSLQALHRQHSFHVPFENLDIHLGKTISLAPGSLFDKIVLKQRGGYCFELNGLFQLLLEALGFQVHSAAARVLFDSKEIPPRSHRILIVAMDGAEWLVDVGFGAYGLLEPIPLTAGIEHRQYMETFKLAAHPTLGFVFQAKIHGQWVDQYGFTTEPHLPVDFTYPNYYHSHASESIFTQKKICQLPTPEGRKRFVDHTLTLVANGHTHKIEAASADEYSRLLETHFAIKFPPP